MTKRVQEEQCKLGDIKHQGCHRELEKPRADSTQTFIITLILSIPWCWIYSLWNHVEWISIALLQKPCGISKGTIIYSWRFFPIFYPVLAFSSISVHYSYILLTRIIICRTGKASFGNIQHFSMSKSFESSFLTMTQKTSVLKRLHLSPVCYYPSFFLF